MKKNQSNVAVFHSCIEVHEFLCLTKQSEPCNDQAAILLRKLQILHFKNLESQRETMVKEVRN
jgi:hypothetical protein